MSLSTVDVDEGTELSVDSCLSESTSHAPAPNAKRHTAVLDSSQRTYFCHRSDKRWVTAAAADVHISVLGSWVGFGLRFAGLVRGSR